MDKKTAGLLGAVAGLATLGPAQAAQPVAGVAETLAVTSYADLLAPIPDAARLPQADDAVQARVRDVNGYVYFNYGPPPPYAYERPYAVPNYGPYYPRYYHHHH